MTEEGGAMTPEDDAQAVLSAYLDGECTPEERTRLDAHLDRLASSVEKAMVPAPSRDVLARDLRAVASAHGGACRIRHAEPSTCL